MTPEPLAGSSLVTGVLMLKELGSMVAKQGMISTETMLNRSLFLCPALCVFVVCSFGMIMWMLTNWVLLIFEENENVILISGFMSNFMSLGFFD